ncbi:hypothetical protein CISG_07746 [Coccidioides immitis RMSCC 3703]|uniref:Uncharacterized protein n=1 Tax=Coccidioides immitis RMSCC 3703 TaxID=454286 RepID=A0A0J8R4F3_COCIT|nr:hypothetical protein CISG_07746 [Coccidioides immitis RMSCC 3703]
MPVVLQSTIDLLEAELVKARAALQQVQAEPTVPVAENVTAGAMEAYKVHLVGCASRKQSNHSFLPLIDDSFVRYSSMTARNHLETTLQYAVRPGRAKGTPRLKGIYHFSPKDSDQPSCHQTTLGKRRRPDLAQTGHHTNHAYHPHHSEKDVQHRHEWYKPSGQVLKGTITNGWAQTLQLCERIISFDAVLCRSPRHDPNSFTGENSKRIGSYLQPAIATVALGPRGCEGCGTASEGPAVWGYSPEEYFPLLAPPPLHSSRIAVAKNPAVYKNESPTLIMQCEDCVRNRLCRRCNRWWCSDCLQDPEILRTPGTAYQPPGMFAGMEQSKDSSIRDRRLEYSLSLPGLLPHEVEMKSNVLPETAGSAGPRATGVIHQDVVAGSNPVKGVDVINITSE